MAEKEIGRAGVEAFFTRRIRLIGGKTIKLAPIEAGTPDRLVIAPGGRMFLVELKAEGKTPSDIQKNWHTQVLRSQGVQVHVVTGITGARDFIRWVVEGSPRTKRYRASADVG